jgi:hypothetical protein
MADCNLTSTQSIKLLFFTLLYTFCPSFIFFSFLLRLDLLATATTPWVVVDLFSSLCQTPIDQEKDALAGAGGAPDCCRSRRNRTIRFAEFRARASGSCSFHV